MPNEPAYTTVNKVPISRVTDTGEVVSKFRITARSRGGSVFSIEIADADLAKAPALLEAKAKQLDAI